MNYFASKEAAGFGFKDILYEKKDWVARITINRPESFNCYTTSTLQELITAIDDASNDDKVGVIVLTGAGDKAFCTGGDVKEYAGIYTKSPHDYFKYMGLFAKYIESILRSGKVTIARINGIAVGGGNETQLACDLAVMADDTYLGQVGTSVGSVACGGATQWLSITVGDRRARADALPQFAHPRGQGARVGAGEPRGAARPARRRGGDALQAAARQVPRVHALHQAAGELLEGSRVARHGGTRARLAVDPLHDARALRGHAGLRREAEGGLPRPAPEGRRRRRQQRVRVGAVRKGMRECGAKGIPRQFDFCGGCGARLE